MRTQVTDAVERCDAARVVRETLARLTERQRAVLVLRYGIGSQRPMTLRECGEHFNLSTERIRQIEAKALRCVAQPQFRETLSEALEAFQETGPAPVSQLTPDDLGPHVVILNKESEYRMRNREYAWARRRREGRKYRNPAKGA